MRQRFVECALVATTALAWAPAWAQSVPPVSVSVQPPAAVQVVLFTADTSDKVLTTTDQKGNGSIDGGALAKLGRLEVIEESCGTNRRVLLVASNSKVADRAGCSRRSIGSFSSGDKTLRAELFKPLPRAAVIPDAPPIVPAAAPTPAPVQRTQAAPPVQPARPPVSAAGAGTKPCPPGASMVGAKLDLPTDGDTFEAAPLLSPCAYRGVEDTPKDKWKFYKLQVGQGQTLRVTARLRDSQLPGELGRSEYHLYVRLHDGNGGVIGNVCAIWQPSEICQREFKANESGFAFVSMRWVVRDAAFLISIQ